MKQVPAGIVQFREDYTLPDEGLAFCQKESKVRLQELAGNDRMATSAGPSEYFQRWSKWV